MQRSPTPHARILRLARSGSPGRAWLLMREHGLLDSADDPRALTLEARLVKDRARLASGAERVRLFGESAALYRRAAALAPASYPLINAASLALLAGHPGEAGRLAREVLALLDANPDEAETPYWLGATRAEALLLLGKETEARAALRAAIARQPAAWEDHAATLGQFALLCPELGLDCGWLDALRPPASLQYAGIMQLPQGDAVPQQAITDWLEQENIGFGYGPAAAGADLWIAEALLDRGAQLHLVLPCAVDVFSAQSVRAVDWAWEPRFERVLAAAHSLTCLDHAALPDPGAIALAEAVALGMARHNAQVLRSDVRRLRIVGTEDSWPEPSAAVRQIPARRLAGAGRRSRQIPGAARALVQRRDGCASHDGLGVAWQALAVEGGAAALDVLPAGDAPAPPEAQERLAAMLDCAEDDQVIATAQAAYALLAQDASVRVEQAGEMRWAGGTMPLCALVAQ